MSQPQPVPTPPAEPAWDIRFTRLAMAACAQVDPFVASLAQRFQAMGLDTDAQRRQTPRGLSTLLAVVGRRGLVCIVDITLIDGMAIGQGPQTALDIRLLDACGAVEVGGLARGLLLGDGEPTALPARMARAVTSVHVSAMGHFDLAKAASHRA